MKEFKATNTGNKIIINCAKTREVQRLKNVILKEMKKSPIGIKLTGGENTFFEKEMDFTGVIDFIKDTLISIETSDEFNEAIFECLKYCTYKTVYKIDEALFDNEQVPEAREDYYEIIIACLEENLRPFFKSLISMWKTHTNIVESIQKLSIM